MAFLSLPFMASSTGGGGTTIIQVLEPHQVTFPPEMHTIEFAELEAVGGDMAEATVNVEECEIIFGTEDHEIVLPESICEITFGSELHEIAFTEEIQ